METYKGRTPLPDFLHCAKSRVSNVQQKGQALVEFTLCFMLLLVVAWIPADFGLSFLSGQIMQNAAREGARIAAADPAFFSQLGTCNVATNCFTLTPGTLRYEIAKRLTVALMPDAQITVDSPSGSVTGCDAVVRVQIQGNYYFTFYRMLNWFGANINPATLLRRATTMRYEHQC